MKKYPWLVLALLGFILSLKAFADEVEKKTDGSFVGENSEHPINSSFVGDISNSMVNDSYGRDDLQKKTDSAFVGENSVQADNTYFAGSSYQEQVGNSTVGAFVGDSSFVGNSYGK